MPQFKNQLFPRRHSACRAVAAHRPPRPISPDAFKANLSAAGKTIRQWALENGFNPTQVYRTLNGVEKAGYGRAHEIAVAAGIK